MARERLRVQGELMAHHLSGVIAAMPFVGRFIPPARLNPYGGAREDSPAMTRIRMAMLRIQLSAIAGAEK